MISGYVRFDFFACAQQRRNKVHIIRAALDVFKFH